MTLFQAQQSGAHLQDNFTNLPLRTFSSSCSTAGSRMASVAPRCLSRMFNRAGARRRGEVKRGNGVMGGGSFGPKTEKLTKLTESCIRLRDHFSGMWALVVVFPFQMAVEAFCWLGGPSFSFRALNNPFNVCSPMVPDVWFMGTIRTLRLKKKANPRKALGLLGLLEVWKV